jgi:hypothetical protein
MIEIKIKLDGSPAMTLKPANDRDKAALFALLKDRVVQAIEERADGSWELKFTDAPKSRPSRGDGLMK